jgi:hypothetical protein
MNRNLDLYMANVGPAACHQNLGYVIYEAGSPAAEGNTGWQDSRGAVTVASAAAYYDKQDPTPTW